MDPVQNPNNRWERSAPLAAVHWNNSRLAAILPGYLARYRALDSRLASYLNRANVAYAPGECAETIERYPYAGTPQLDDVVRRIRDGAW
jgi:hypothetical protein